MLIEQKYLLRHLYPKRESKMPMSLSFIWQGPFLLVYSMNYCVKGKIEAFLRVTSNTTSAVFSKLPLKVTQIYVS